MEEPYVHAILLYPSQQDLVFSLYLALNPTNKSDLNLENVCFRKTHKFVVPNGSILQNGDVFRVPVMDSTTKYKFVYVAGGYQKGTVPLPSGKRNHTIIIEVPPGKLLSSNSSHKNITFPNAEHTRPVRGPEAIWEAVKAVTSTEFEEVLEKPSQLWKEITVSRGPDRLGSLQDIRLAFQFAMNEHDLQTELTFARGRSRKIPTNAKQAGFYLSDSSGLYLKTPLIDAEKLNKTLLLHLGTELNEELASFAEPGYAIVMVDARVMISDGLPVPDNTHNIDSDGPERFPTEFTKKIAGSCGWSKGYAHMGLESLCGPPDRRLEKGVFAYVEAMMSRKGLEIPKEERVWWTKGEEKKVDKFQKDKLEGQIRHYPIPLTRQRLAFLNVDPITQYRKSGDDWVVDSRVHGDSGEEQRVTSQQFEDARVLGPAGESRRPKPVYETHPGRSSFAYFANYETVGRLSPAPSGRNGPRAWGMAEPEDEGMKEPDEIMEELDEGMEEVEDDDMKETEDEDMDELEE